MKQFTLALTAMLAGLFSTTFAFASGGYDNGTPAGKGNWDIDITINPADKIESGQSYLVWGYGMTDQLDFHGYVSHEAAGTDQLYYGLMYNFYSNDWLDLSTAIGLRHRLEITDIFLPQLLYTIKMPKGFDVIGSAVNVYNITDGYNRDVALDVALRIPVPIEFTPTFVRDIKVSIGAFRAVSGTWNPTYSVDFRF